MKPIQTKNTNLVYWSKDPEIGDLHCQRVRVGHIRTIWSFTREERAHIAAGGNLEVDIYTEPIPPMSVSTTNEEGYGEDNPYFEERIAELKRKYASSTDEPDNED